MKAKKVIKFICLSLLVVFLFSYFIEKSGYYEYNLQKKKTLTEEEIKQFESDVKEGKNIDLNEYLQDDSIDYTNKLTDTTSNISLKLNKYLKKIINNSIKVLSKLIK